MTVGPHSQDGALQTPVTPVTPVKPATPGTLALLHNLIKQDAHMVDNTGKQRLQRRVQKLASAAQISFAERALLRDQNRFLTKMNNEMKTRRSTKMVVLGRAKVMSFGDLNEVRAKRAAIDKASKSKGKYGRKRKASVLDAGASELDAKTVQLQEAEPSGPPVAQTSTRLEQRRAPMAWMAGDL
ncbi:MAG: hypothetical protein MMC23_002024 [Stictis urceolatum]|nr:hypothetical protein [Stictis urceolata]